MTATAAKERSIIFHARSIQAILAGRKTQTRRIIKPQPVWVGDPCVPFKTADADPMGIIHCPYGKPGDRLWVRESWRTGVELDDLSPSKICDRCLDAGYLHPWIPILYVADGATENGDSLNSFGDAWGRVRSPLHLPRWASRLTLEITDIRVQRLQEISEADAMAEGVEPYHCPSADALMNAVGGGMKPIPYTSGFANLWNDTNGTGAWERNDLVWALTVKREERP